LTHTRRAYQNPKYNGRGKWYFEWIHEIKKPWRQMTNKMIVDHKEEGIPKKLMSKRRRQFYKQDLRDIIRNSFIFNVEEEGIL
jgi:hypothetical protein